MVEPLGVQAWAAAQALIGVPFRLHGRDPATGLDCVGLVAAAYHEAGYAPAFVPDRYRLRGESDQQILAWLADLGFVAAASCVPGDVVLSAVGADHHHLLLSAPGMTIHAHAGLRRVVAMPGDWPGPVVGRFRLHADACG